MSVSRRSIALASRSLALALSCALAFPLSSFAVEMQAPVASGVIRPVVLPALPAATLDSAQAPSADLSAPLAAAPAVAAHPVVELINQLQAKGISLPAQAATRADAQKILEAASALPEGSTRQRLTLMAQSVLSGSGAAPSVANLPELGRLFDNAAKAQTAGVLASLAGWKWLPSGLRKHLGERAESAVVYPQPENAEKFAVPLEKLRWVPAPAQLPQSTKDIPAAERKIVGQDRALASIRYGLKMPGGNHNLYVSGSDGSGRETALMDIAQKLAAQRTTPNDQVSVTNPADRSQPLILTLPAGQGPRLSAALKDFVKTYQAMLPQILNSGAALDARKKIHAQAQAAVAQAKEEFDAEVAQIRLPGGKFGVNFEVEKGEGSISYFVGLTYAKDGKFEPVTPEETKALVTAGAITQEELEQARRDAAVEGEKISDKFSEMMYSGSQIQAKADEQIGEINKQAAEALSEQLRGGLLKEVTKNRHDTPAHDAYEKAAEARLEAFEAEAAKPALLGRYGFRIVTDGQRIIVGLTQVVDGQAVPVAPEELQGKLSSGELTQEQIHEALAPLLEKFKAVMKQNNDEHAAVHANDEPIGDDERKAIGWVAGVLQSVVSNYSAFLPSKGGDEEDSSSFSPADFFQVNVLGTNEPGKGAPVVFDRNPSLEGTFGVGEDHDRMRLVPGVGAVKSSSPSGPELKPGTLLKANGGIWVAYAMDVLRAPGVFAALMQFARDGQVEIVEGGLRSLMTMSGDKYHVPAKAKVVLIGSPMIRMMLAEHDEDFARAFNATAEFEPQLPINEVTIAGYLQFFRNAITDSKGQLLEMSRDAISAVLEFAARILRSNENVTARFGVPHALMQEATFFAREAGRTEVRREDVEKALIARSESASVWQRQYQQTLFNNEKIVETQGAKVGQLNGLAVLGDLFGSPMRVTIVNSASPGGFQISFNDEKAGWTGNYFKKSAATVEGFLEGLFGAKLPLKVKLAISFEQTSGLDGDSATSTMMYGSLSSLSGVAIKQNFAVTGSADQFGNVQPIGGINEKIEGFFDLCAHRGLTGDQGIVMPASNVGDLMLRPDIVEAVRQGRFHIYAVSNVKQGLEILTGVSFEEIATKAKKHLAQLRGGAAAQE